MATFNQLANEYAFKSDTERNKALSDIMSKIQKTHGKESITKLDGSINLDIPNIPSEILSLDVACGIGGLPKGRIIEFYGDNSAGKCLTYETHIDILIEDSFYQYLKSRGFIENGEQQET